MIRGLMNSIMFAGFTLLLPVFGFMAWGWGSSDEKFLMKVGFCLLSPLCACLWCVLISPLVFRRPARYLTLFLIIVFGYAGVVLMLKSGMMTF